MAIAFGAAGTTSSSATSTVTPAYPTVAAGDYMVLKVAHKYATPTVATPSGWTALGAQAGGAGTDGTVDEGQVKLWIFGKEATGSESGTLSVSNSGGTASCLSARILSFTKGASETWDVVGNALAADNTAGTSLVWTYDTDPGLTVNDWALTVWAINSDAYTHTHAFSASGVSAVTTQSRSNVTVTAGANMRHGLVTHSIDTGTATGVATYTNTSSGSATNVGWIGGRALIAACITAWRTLRRCRMPCWLIG